MLTPALAIVIALGLASCALAAAPASRPFDSYILGYDTPLDPELQKKIEALDANLREKLGISGDVVEVGVLDLEHCRLALIHPEREDYAASVAKVGILLAYFQLHPEAAEHLDPTLQHELGLMAKASSNEMASKFSHEMTLRKVQEVINSYDLYNARHGGGIWVGKHYGKDTEKIMDPVGNNSHAITVRQMLRFWLWLEQGKLVSPAASMKMRAIFASPDIPHDNIKFVKGLKGRDVQIVRKWGSWENWLHDTAVITAPGRHYILVAMTQHPRGDEYLEQLAPAVDDLMQGKP